MFFICSLMESSQKDIPDCASYQGIGQRPLADFPDAFIMVTCCGETSKLPVAQLLKSRREYTVAETIDGIKCGRCGELAQTAYLQEKELLNSTAYAFIKS